MAVGPFFAQPKQGSQPVDRPGPARRPATPQSRPAWEPAWAGQGAGHPAEPASLGAGP